MSQLCRRDEPADVIDWDRERQTSSDHRVDPHDVTGRVGERAARIPRRKPHVGMDPAPCTRWDWRERVDDVGREHPP